MPVNISTLKTMLSKYLIDETTFPDIPKSLKGEILLEVAVDENGIVKGWITVKPDAFLQILLQRDNSTLRPDLIKDLTKDEYIEATGWKKYLDKWSKEGIVV